MVQIISKGLLVSSNSPKKQTNEFVFTTTTKSFVRFLGEFEDTKSPFEIIWPLIDSKFPLLSSFLKPQFLDGLKSSENRKYCPTIARIEHETSRKGSSLLHVVRCSYLIPIMGVRVRPHHKSAPNLIWKCSSGPAILETEAAALCHQIKGV